VSSPRVIGVDHYSLTAGLPVSYEGRTDERGRGPHRRLVFVRRQDPRAERWDRQARPQRSRSRCGV